MKIIATVVLCIVFVSMLCGCVAAIAHAESSDPERKTLEEHVAQAVTKNDKEIYTIAPFFGGETSDKIKGFMASVYDDYGIRYYCVYVELEEVHADGLYLANEIEVDADLYNREYIFFWGAEDDE